MDPETLARIPTSPGVYIMKDKRGRVIYVGKAKDLRARVRAYFRPSGDERTLLNHSDCGVMILHRIRK